MEEGNREEQTGGKERGDEKPEERQKIKRIKAERERTSAAAELRAVARGRQAGMQGGPGGEKELWL